VNAGHRGRGYAREVVNGAIERAELLGPEFMLLFCHRDRVGLYGKLGFTEIAGSATVEQPEGNVTMPMVAMWRALRTGAAWPEGSVAVLSLPF
jgi:predicted N-acetyltransferase YhbS